jgi:hypothetical protein
MPTLQDVLKQVPSDVKQFPVGDPGPARISYVRQRDARFVAPDLAPVNGLDVEAGTTALLLISAPAAVGKTMLARAIAHETGAVLWDLAAFQVGSNFLAGTVGTSHGWEATSDVMNAMASGDFMIVMDALDEAAIKAGLANLEAFALDLATVLNGMKPARPPVAILARAETAELAQLIFEEHGLPIAHYSIAYFDQAKAEEFLDRKLDQRSNATHRSHRAPFEKARDQLFSKVFSVLGLERGDWDEPEAVGFLGYAPVLEALSEYLDHPNYAALATEIEGSFAGEQPGSQSIWRFLIGIVERVLDREQLKLRDNLPDDLVARISEGGSFPAVYSPEEQCARLTARAVKQPQPEPTLPREVRDEYEEAVRQILEEHPFVGPTQTAFANVVFGDYLFASALLTGPTGYRTGVRGLVSEPGFRPSPLLARFMLELSPQGDGGTQIRAADFPIFYESLRAEDAAEQSVSLSVTESDREIVAQVISPTAGHLDLVVEVGEDEALEISRRLSHAQVVLEHTPITFGGGGEAFTLGPNTSIRAPELLVRARELRVETRPEADGGVLLAAGTFRCDSPDPQVTSYGPGRVELAVPHTLTYPWAQYRVDLPPPERNGKEDIAEALAELAKLVTWFKSEGFGGLGMYAKPLDAAAAKGRVSQVLLDYALERGLITKEEKLYYLHPADFGLSLQQVKAKIASESVRQFLEGFVAKDR